MSNPVLMKRSTVAAKVPLITDLQLGELAINTADGYLFLKKDVGGAQTVVQIGAVSSVAGRTGTIILNKSDVGLGNVDNTADSAKPVSTIQQTALNLKANLVSPVFSGVPVAPTAALGISNTQIATTEFVTATLAADTTRALIVSPAFIGAPTAPTATVGTNTAQIATTEFVETALVNFNFLGQGQVISSSTAANQVLDSNSTSTCRSAKYQIQSTSGTTFQTTELMIVHDGTNASLVQYGDISTGDILSTYDADVSGGNIRLLATPVNTGTTFKFLKTVLA
jgi:hypothetical protein